MAYAEIDRSLRKRGHLLIRRHFSEHGPDHRKLLPQRDNQRRQQLVQRSGDETDPDVAGGPGTRAAGNRPCRLRILKRPSRLGKQRRARPGQCKPAVCALEKFYAELPFQPGDGLAQRRLRHAEPLRGAPHMQGFGHGDEMT